MANKQDEQVQALFKIVQEKKAEIAKTEKPSWETNCSFRYNPNSASEDHQIQTVKKVSDLVRIAAFIIEKKQSHDKANEMLETNVKFDWLGFSLEAWISDIKTRVNKIDISKKRDELEKLETRLNSLISPELRNQMELEEITALLKGGKA